MSNTEGSKSVTFKTGTFNFTATNINDLESSAYTLVVIALDTSVSIANFAASLMQGLKDVIQSCQDSPRSDNLMIRLVTFDRTVNEFHGFKELNKCVLSDYDNVMNNLGGSTSLFDATVNAIESANTYGAELASPGNDYDVNAIVVIITDGDDNSSSYTIKSVKDKLQAGVGEKKLESLISVLVGVNTADSGCGIKNFSASAGFTKYIDIEKASPKDFAKLFEFISKSISSQSQALNSGSAAPSLNF